MAKDKILVICIHNSARSQMAEEYLRLYGQGKYDVESAGLEPGTLNEAVIELLKEDGIDISGKKTRSVFDLHEEGHDFDYVVAVCDPEAKEQCPIFPAEKERLHWPFPDPSKTKGGLKERIEAIRPIRDMIKTKCEEFAQRY